jgi:MSHA biogenesis protein MshP
MRQLPHPLRARKTGGFTMVSAIFILVVLAGLGAAMVTISGVQHKSSTLDLMGSRVYQAARAGVEWGAYTVSNGTACFASPSTFVPQATTLNTFTVQVTCNRTDSNGVVVYDLISTACNFPVNGACPGDVGNEHYVERVIQVSL